MNYFEKKSLSESNEICQALEPLIKTYKIICFNGSMGSGKTTLIKAFCKYLGSLDTISSPTYSLVNEYELSNHKKIFHFDFYRLNNPQEALDFGVEEYFHSGQICLIEWGSNVAEYLPIPYLKVDIEGINESRNYRISIFNGS